MSSRVVDDGQTVDRVVDDGQTVDGGNAVVESRPSMAIDEEIWSRMGASAQIRAALVRLSVRRLSVGARVRRFGRL